MCDLLLGLPINKHRSIILPRLLWFPIESQPSVGETNVQEGKLISEPRSFGAPDAAATDCFLLYGYHPLIKHSVIEKK